MFKFGRISELESEVRDLRYEIKRLKGRLDVVENDCSPFRIGNPSFSCSIYGGYHDDRPKVSLRRAVSLLCEHLKLRFSHTSAKPEFVALEKVK